MPLQDRISEDLKDAMRQKDELRRSTLRMIRSAIQYEEINEKKVLSDAATIDILSRMARQHQESIAEYKRGGRHDLVEREEAELSLIRQYMMKLIIHFIKILTKKLYNLSCTTNT